MKEGPKAPMFHTFEDEVEVSCQHIGTTAFNYKEYLFEARGPGKEGQDEFLGRIRLTVCAHGLGDDFHRYILIRAEDGKPLEFKRPDHTVKATGHASFYPKLSSDAELVSKEKGYSLILPGYALMELRLEMMPTKPPGEMF